MQGTHTHTHIHAIGPNCVFSNGMEYTYVRRQRTQHINFESANKIMQIHETRARLRTVAGTDGSHSHGHHTGWNAIAAIAGNFGCTNTHTQTQTQTPATCAFGPLALLFIQFVRPDAVSSVATFQAT